MFKKSGGAEYIIAGLGNPGKKYDGTRHNAGFRAADAIAETCGVKIKRSKFGGLTETVSISGKKCLLLKPLTFMNLSGQSVCEAMNFFKIPPERTLILFDDITAEAGGMRIRLSGSHGGHNGMKDIISRAGSDAFPRIKIGVGDKPNPEYDLAAWVLSKFSAAEEKHLAEVLSNVPKAAELIIAGRAAEAMNSYN